jgi:arylsulfatase A-like enzyme/thioredoxin-like negative regulator of GroEL
MRRAAVQERKGRRERKARCFSAYFAVFAFFTVCGCSRAPSSAVVPPAPDSNVLVITIDTLRADHLGPYGYARLKTPAIERLAREGVVFKAAYTTAPLTLPAHCTIFTGLLPARHGVRDNGGFFLEPTRPTLATELKARGYSSAAFVSAFVLDSRWGLSNGFDEYYDNFRVSLGDLAAMARVQRQGGETWAQAREWIAAHAADRFFVWMHLFDPHTPYAPPEPFRTRFADRPYDGEIAYVDSILSEVVEELSRRSLLQKTMVVVLSDHGEGLGDHDEDEHGLLVSDTTLHVPWIVRLPDRQFAGTVVDRPVSLVDVMPTVLDLTGAPVPNAIDGTSRVGLMRAPASGQTDVLYAETLYPRLRFGWNELLSVRTDRFKLVRGGRTELYDYVNDPGETRNLAGERPEIVSRLDGIAARLARDADPSSRAPRTDAAAASRLRSLGYVSGSASIAGAGISPADPRDKTAAYRELMRAHRLLEEGDEREGIGTLQRLIAREPAFDAAHRSLREAWATRGRTAEAERWLRGRLAERPGDVRLLIDLAAIHRAAGQPDRALTALNAALRQDAGGVGDAGAGDNFEALVLAGETLRDLRQYDQALERFTRAGKVAPADGGPRMQIATTLFAMGRLADAEAATEAALAADAHAAGAHYLLAQLAEQRADGSTAEREYRREITESPWEYRARFNLARLLSRRGAHGEALALLESIPPLAPDFADLYFFLAKAILDAGDPRRFPDAIAAANRGLTAAPRSASAPLGHYVLGDIYRLQGRRADSDREINRGRALEQLLSAPGRR